MVASMWRFSGVFVVMTMVFMLCTMQVTAQNTPIQSPTNAYFTPSQTYTPITTLQTVTNGKPMTISGVGPDLSTNPYTWNYTAPQSTLDPTTNPAIMSSLAKAGVPVGPSVSNLQPDPANLQTAGAMAHTVNYALLALAAVLGVAAARL